MHVTVSVRLSIKDFPVHDQSDEEYNSVFIVASFKVSIEPTKARVLTSSHHHQLQQQTKNLQQKRKEGKRCKPNLNRACGWWELRIKLRRKGIMLYHRMRVHPYKKLNHVMYLCKKASLKPEHCMFQLRIRCKTRYWVEAQYIAFLFILLLSSVFYLSTANMDGFLKQRKKTSGVGASAVILTWNQDFLLEIIMHNSRSFILSEAIKGRKMKWYLKKLVGREYNRLQTFRSFQHWYKLFERLLSLCLSQKFKSNTSNDSRLFDSGCNTNGYCIAWKVQLFLLNFCLLLVVLETSVSKVSNK